VTQVFVAIDDDGIAGFYSLSMFTVALEHLPPDLARKLPRYEAIPAALIGRLARHERTRGTGMGDILLADALRRTLSASETIAAYAILLDAKDEAAARFYQARGFAPLPDKPDRLFILSETVSQAIG
jgi:predicted GNAT family N-acyltransferase